jgi:hypothetical protein
MGGLIWEEWNSIGACVGIWRRRPVNIMHRCCLVNAFNCMLCVRVPQTNISNKLTCEISIMCQRCVHMTPASFSKISHAGVPRGQQSLSGFVDAIWMEKGLHVNDPTSPGFDPGHADVSECDRFEYFRMCTHWCMPVCVVFMHLKDMLAKNNKSNVPTSAEHCTVHWTRRITLRTIMTA